MHGFESTERLVDEVLAVVVGEFLRSDDAVHVGLHELLWHRQHSVRPSRSPGFVLT